MTLKESFDLTGRTALVTGGAGILGPEFARAMLEFGARVVIADISEEKARAAAAALAKDYPEGISTVVVDITEKESVTTAFEEVRRDRGGIDILVNCAALDPKFDGDAQKHEYGFEDYPLELWNRALAVNLTGAFLCSQVVGGMMVEQGRGVIVNVASELGIIAPDHRIYLKKNDPARRQYKPPDYPVTKAALLHLTRYMAAYWRGKNIRVNSLTPAAVSAGQDQELMENISYRTILGRMSEKDEFSGALVFLVSDASSYMTGANLVIDGGRSAW